MNETTPEPLSFDIHSVKELLPHRYPFLYIDKMRDVILGESAVGIKNVSANEEIFQGHFPDKPVFPGVLIIEAMAQAASALVVETLGLRGQNPLVYFMSLEATKFRKLVEPGDQLELHVKLIRKRGKVWKFRGEGIVAGKLVAESEFTAMIVLPKAE
ncbi:MAG TPA: 3-hydroxyacyl-ACP dehydratase FabZ [Rhodobacteraceae bacterium]|nr:3-hydroxyacyl-ACP dehydratase FabZ [Paracoccaceae bacterium]